jgi:hypothetical protein
VAGVRREWGEQEMGGKGRIHSYGCCRKRRLEREREREREKNQKKRTSTTPVSCTSACVFLFFSQTRYSLGMDSSPFSLSRSLCASSFV